MADVPDVACRTSRLADWQSTGDHRRVANALAIRLLEYVPRRRGPQGGRRCSLRRGGQASTPSCCPTSRVTLDYLTLDVLAGDRPPDRIDDLGPGPRAARLAAARPRTPRSATSTPTRRFADKAAALLHAVARNHALVDGNKRLAVVGDAGVLPAATVHDIAMTVGRRRSTMVVGVAAVGATTSTSPAVMTEIPLTGHLALTRSGGAAVQGDDAAGQVAPADV